MTGDYDRCINGIVAVWEKGMLSFASAAVLCDRTGMDLSVELEVASLGRALAQGKAHARQNNHTVPQLIKAQSNNATCNLWIVDVVHTMAMALRLLTSE
jgi:hypothetical protein